MLPKISQWSGIIGIAATIDERQYSIVANSIRAAPDRIDLAIVKFRANAMGGKTGFNVGIPIDPRHSGWIGRI